MIARDVPAQLERDLQGAVGVAEEVHLGDAHLGRRLALLVLAHCDELRPVEARVGAAGRPVGHDAVDDLDPSVGPGRDRTCGTEVDVVRVRADDQHLGGVGRLAHCATRVRRHDRDDPRRLLLVLPEPG